MSRLKRFLTVLVTLMFSLAAQAGSHINILVYHHVSENTPASTSVSPAQFREHLQLLQDNGFNVVDLESTLAQLQRGETVPDNAVAITFDDGYHNIYDNAWPLLKTFNFPFTVFVATDAIDQQYSDMMSWDQLRDMHQAGVTIANHSSDHGYLVRHQPRDEQWLTSTIANIEHAQERLEEELGSGVPKWLAYPYGEFSDALAERLQTLNYTAFAQHSGGVWSGSDFQAIPRFAAAGIYANPKTLLTKLQSRPMPVDEAQVSDMVTTQSRPELVATLVERNDFAKALNCFVDGAWQDSSWPSDLTFRVQSDTDLGEGRHRYNCTAKARSGDFYYWYSKPWLIYGQQDR
ncbi:polysaccharide deacetylase family protein [Reinekea blandensis]|uniref:Polysaccharide deacetylase family protein n=1 Tax=Reinekea blandensis MED297 TaxID=314283 RepID=A4BGT2_9GAMM|nr:polysaccharide deacetylase family protein [Reinekea blandensis]EAR08730.1 Polysaccharide deacetylase family protein [Reinekea sp. MED297] [Reinekea blandensis MED297]